jgi:hypothetical protein
MGRVIGHGIGGLFMALGVLFLVLAYTDPVTTYVDSHSTCAYGSDCASSSVSGTFLFIGIGFFLSGLFASVITEFAIRKTRRLMSSVATFTANPPQNMAQVGDFLHECGIDLQNTPGVASLANIPLQTSVERPVDAAGLSSYLKQFGVSIDEERLKHATILQGGTVINAGSASPAPSSPQPAAAPSPVSMFGNTTDLQRISATIVRKKDRGETTGNQRLLELELEVHPVGKVPYRVQLASLVRESLAGLLIEGSNVNVRVDPGNPNNVTIDWSEN